MKQLFLLVFLFLPKITISQIDTVNSLYEKIESELLQNIENVAEDMEEEVDYYDELEDVLQCRDAKIDINHLSPDMAFTVLKLSDYQYYHLLSYIEKYGKLVSLSELFAIEGFSREDIERILPFVEIGLEKKRTKFFRHFFSKSKNQLLLRYSQILEKQAGYEPGKKNGYLGSPQKLAFRYIFTSQRNFQFGLTGAKDAGEQFFKGAQKQGFDFYSVHFNMKHLGFVRNIIVGDYKLGFGQGLVIWSGSAVRGGSSVSALRRFSTGIRPATGFNETDFYRGAAVELGNHRFAGTLFYSYHLFDGKIVQDESGNDVFEGSLFNTGYHRTESEVTKKGVLKNRLYGFNFQMTGRILKLGIRVVKTDFMTPLGEYPELYKKYDFTGNRNINAGVDYHVIMKKSVCFGEVAVSRNLGIAFLQGIIMEPDPRVKIGVLGRYYDKKYQALNSNAFGKNSANRNETGICLSVNLIVTSRMEVFLRSDLYCFPWLRYRTDRPSAGIDVLAEIKTMVNRKTTISLQYRFEMKEQNMGARYYTNEVNGLNRHKFRAQLENSPWEFLKLKTQVGWAYNVAKSIDYKKNGLLLFQDISCSIRKYSLDIKVRFALFDTDSYDERLYAYENDLLYSFTVNGYYYRGWRGYFMIKYTYKFVDFWIRIAQTFYMNKTEIGSGQDLISGRTKTELKVQTIFKL